MLPSEPNLRQMRGDYLSISLGDVTESEMWEVLNTVPAGVRPRLIVIRHADRLSDLAIVKTISAESKKNPQRYIIFVSDETSLPREDNKVIPALRLGQRAHVIECRPFTAATAPTAVRWVQSKAKMREGIAGYLLNRADGNIRLVRDVCFKLSLIPNTITMATVNDLLSEYPRQSFEMSLFSFDKRGALMALDRLRPDEYSRVIGSLDSTLDLVGVIHDMQVNQYSPQQIARACGSRGFLVPDLLPVAKKYTQRKRDSIRQVLVSVDSLIKQGERSGVMESLVALW